MKHFAMHFREHVLPRLRNLAAAEGMCVAIGLETFADGHAAIWAYASKYGACYLPGYMLDEMNDWVMSTLRDEVAKAKESPNWSDLFTTYFRITVIPRLRNLTRAQAVCIAQGVETFAGGSAAISAYSRENEPSHLPDDMVTKIDNWICSTLLAEIDKAEGSGG